MTALADSHCTATPEALDTAGVKRHLAAVSDWQIDASGKQLCREFSFRDYYGTLAFVNAVAWIANRENHHPDLQVGYNRCTVCYQTHSLGALSLNDFICATRIDALFDKDHA